MPVSRFPCLARSSPPSLRAPGRSETCPRETPLYTRAPELGKSPAKKSEEKGKTEAPSDASVGRGLASSTRDPVTHMHTSPVGLSRRARPRGARGGRSPPGLDPGRAPKGSPTDPFFPREATPSTLGHLNWPTHPPLPRPPWTLFVSWSHANSPSPVARPLLRGKEEVATGNPRTFWNHHSHTLLPHVHLPFFPEGRENRR